MVDQTADVVGQHGQRRDCRGAGERVDHRARGYGGSAALRALLGRHDAESAERRVQRVRHRRPEWRGRHWAYTPRGYIVAGMTETQHQMHTEHAEHGTDQGHAGHGGHGDHVAQFRRLFWTMLVLAVPTVALSGMFAMILGYSVPGFPGAQWVSPLLGTVMYVWGGRPFLSGAISEMRSRAPGMMLLIGLAITVAFIASWGASLGGLPHNLDFWWELALLIVIMLLGHWIEMRSLAQTTSALDSLAALLPDEAERVTADGTETVAPADLRLGDVVIVRPGGSVPADGVIVDGAAEMDESMVTGESRPVRRGVGEAVVAGTVATDSGLRVKVTAVGDDTALAGIQRLVNEAQNSSSRAQRLADRAAAWLFWFALGAAVVTAVVWGYLGQPEDAVIRTITVLVIACPHALGLAIPLVVSIATERAARGGVLIKDRLALESMRTVGAVLFDKTGTLTKGEPTVTALVATGGHTEDDGRAGARRGRGVRFRAPPGQGHRGGSPPQGAESVRVVGLHVVPCRRRDGTGRRQECEGRWTAHARGGRLIRAARSGRLAHLAAVHPAWACG